MAISSSATWRPGFRPPLRPMSTPNPRNYDTNQRVECGRLGVPPRRCSGPGLPGGGPGPGDHRRQTGRTWALSAVSGILPLFRLRRRQMRDTGHFSTIFGCWTTSRISPAIPAWSSQGREPGISAVEGSWKSSYRPDGSFLWISW